MLLRFPHPVYPDYSYFFFFSVWSKVANLQLVILCFTTNYRNIWMPVNMFITLVVCKLLLASSWRLLLFWFVSLFVWVIMSHVPALGWNRVWVEPESRVVTLNPGLIHSPFLISPFWEPVLLKECSVCESVFAVSVYLTLF